jgi:hypothetical protein
MPGKFRGNWVIVRRPTSEFSILIAELESLPRAARTNQPSSFAATPPFCGPAAAAAAVLSLPPAISAGRLAAAYACRAALAAKRNAAAVW